MFQPLMEYLRGALEELKKVTWPPRTQVVRDTLLVILASAVTAVFLGSLDFSLQSALKQATQLDRSQTEAAAQAESSDAAPAPQE